MSVKDYKNSKIIRNQQYPLQEPYKRTTDHLVQRKIHYRFSKYISQFLRGSVTHYESIRLRSVKEVVRASYTDGFRL